MSDDFEQAVREITLRDRRYPPNAYEFLAAALAHTIQRLGRDKHSPGEAERHVSAQELLAGIRDFAAEQFGPLAPTVFESWNVRSSEDFGEMVFSLVENGIWKKTDKDSKDDFKCGFDLKTAFDGELDVRIQDD